MQVSVTRFMWRSSSACFVVRREIAVVRHALVVIVRDEIEDILLEIRAGADDRVHLVLADHLRERDAELGGAHRAGERHQHLAAGGEVRLVALRRVEQRGRVEVTIILRDEFRDRTFFRRERGIDLFRAFRRVVWLSSLGHFVRRDTASACNRPRPFQGKLRLVAEACRALVRSAWVKF